MPEEKKPSHGPSTPKGSQAGDAPIVDPEAPGGLGEHSVTAPKDSRDPDDPAREIITPDSGAS